VTAFGDDKGLYKSTDRGSDWIKLLTDDYMRKVSDSPVDSNILYVTSSRAMTSGGYAAESRGVLFSVDGGQNFSEVNDGMIWPFAHPIALDMQNNIMLGSPGTGFQRTIVPLLSDSNAFAPLGALWHYTQFTLNPGVVSFKTIESVSNIIIDGKLCKKLIEVERYLTDTVQTKNHFMYEEDERVFFYADSSFHLLYDFGAEAGDTLILHYFATYNGEPLKMIIDSTDVIMVNEQERKIQYISCGDGILVEFGQEVIEGLGNTYFMFPTYDGGLNGELRCYEDELVGLYLSPYNSMNFWNGEDCDEVIIGVDITEVEHEVKIFPNPVKHNFVIQIPAKDTKFCRIELYDSLGSLIRVLNDGHGRSLMHFSTPNLSPGMYYIKVEAGSITTIRKLVIIEQE